MSLRALRFLAAQQGWVRAPEVTAVRALGSGRADLTVPRGRTTGTVVVVHGMTPLGPRDPRLVQLHGALAGAGLTVVAPHFPSIAALRIEAGQVTEIADAVEAVARDRSLAPEGRVALLAPSFSGGLALVAAARPRLEGRVSKVLTVGAFGCIRSTLRSAVVRSDLTDFVWKIALASFLDAAIGPCPEIREALRVAALDAWWTDRPPRLPAVRAALKADDRALLDAILGSRSVRQDLLERVLAAPPRLLASASPVDHVEDLEAPVTLLHGLHDRTIPAEQGWRLAEALSAAGRPHRLCITRLLGHGAVTPRPGALVELPGLVGALAGWLDEA